MATHWGKVPAGSVLPFFFDSYAGSSGASVTMSNFLVGDVEVYKGTSMTQRASDAGYALLDTDGIDVDGITGIHGFSIDTGDNTDAGFYAVGSFYTVVVASVTVDSQTVNFVAGTFWLTAAEATAGYPVVDVARISNDSTAADNAELMFDGTGYAGGTTKLDVNAVALSGDTGAADNAEAFFDGTGYAGTGNTIPTVTTVTNQVTANVTQISGDTTAADNLEAACDGTTYNIGGGAVVAGSVTGAVGSVTGNVGGNVVGSVGSVTGAVGSVAANGITATSIAADAINAAALKADAVTKIQNGLATPTNITAGTITTVTNLTNAPTNGDLTATMKTSVTTAATAATPTAAAVTGNVGGNVTGSVGSVTGAVGSVTSPVTVGTNNDKTGYALTAAYDAAKTAATQTSVDDVPTNAELATALAAADDAVLAAIAALNDLSVADIIAGIADGTFDLAEMLRIIFAAVAGKSAGGGTGTVTFRDAADTKDRIAASVDSNGNRIAISLDGSA